MIRYASGLAFVLLATGIAAGQSLSLTGPIIPGDLLEGEGHSIEWKADGCRSVAVVAYAVRTQLGGKSRGLFTSVISDPVPADQGSVPWTVPWVDSIELTVKLKGYDQTGRLVEISEQRYRFRPAVMANRARDGIYLVLHHPREQRLYVQRDGRLVKAYVSSSSRNYYWSAPGVHPRKPHDHAGVFSIMHKAPSYWSREYNVPMPYAMRYHGGHYIHATSRRYYRYLGQPSSHGCNRLTLHDAQELYRMTPVGFRVEIIGPGG